MARRIGERRMIMIHGTTYLLFHRFVSTHSTSDPLSRQNPRVVWFYLRYDASRVVLVIGLNSLISSKLGQVIIHNTNTALLSCTNALLEINCHNNRTALSSRSDHISIGAIYVAVVPRSMLNFRRVCLVGKLSTYLLIQGISTILRSAQNRSYAWTNVVLVVFVKDKTT